MDIQSNCLFITYVEKEGPFLKVWGQTDKNTSLYIEQVLHSFTSQFDNGLCIPHPQTLQIGILCCAKYKDSKYYRSRITSLDFLHNRYIEVNFVDYGHKDVVPISNIRSLEGFEASFISIPPQACSFLLAEAVCPRGEWNDAYLDEICKEIRYSEVNFSIVAQVTKHYLVRLFVGVNDLAIILISKGLMRHTSLTTQEAVLLSSMSRTPLQHTPSQQSIATYKAFTLEPGSQYEVYVSYVTDGPCNFSIQLKQSEEVLGKLMKEINSMSLTPIEGIPIPGTVCLARCMEDGHICRAVVTNEVDGQYKVFYVDFGNFEVIQLEGLYEIPFKYVIPKVMAIRFALAGVEKSSVTLDMQCAFKQFVDNRLIHMKVMPMTTRTSLPRCELWDPESHISALDIVTQAGYPAPVSLNRGFTQPVKVSYVFSCNRFFVQLKSKQDDLLRLMLDIQVLCREAESLGNNAIKVGMPCYALYEGDQKWYRSQLVEVMTNGNVKVQYVDYGNEEVVSISLLRPIEGKQLTVVRPQAIECCLNGYQNMEPDLERDNLLEELILEQEFTMKVVEMQGKKALIELIDAANYNVASLLLDKIAVTRSQVSPMLVQAGNKIEHRKSSHPYNSRDATQKPDQRKPDRNRNSYESNESNESNSWRQNNKGFNKNHDRNKRDDLNDSTDSERHSTKDGYNRNDRNRNDINSRNTEGGSWKQNNRGFNKNQDRFNRDNNRNNDWTGGDERKTTTDKDDWNCNKNNDRQNSNSNNQDDWSGNVDNNQQKDEWRSGQDNDRRNTNSSDWGNGKDGGRPSFKSKNKDDWGSGKDDTRHLNKRGGDDHFNKRGGDDHFNKRGGDDHFNKRGGDDHFNKRGGDDHFNKRGGDDHFNKRGGDDHFNKRGGDDHFNKRGGNDHFNKRGGDDWGNKDRQDKRQFNSREGDDWGNKREKSDWGSQDNRKDRDTFKNKRFNEGGDDWNNTDSGGFKKKSNFKRETSELSSSGSEKSFRKGFRDNQNKPNFKKFDRPQKSNFGDNSGGGDDWNVSTSTTIEVPNPAPSTAEFSLLQVDNTESNVIISWFHNPLYFYCQLESTQDEFKRMMDDIQQAYKSFPSNTAVVGAPVIGLFPEDNVLYRAKVLEVIGSRFKIYYVDFGNISVVDKVWPIETRFMELPAQAICCKLDGIEPPSDTWLDSSNYSQYFDKKQFFCRFIATDSDKVAVNLEHENEDVKALLLRDGLAKSLAPSTPPELPLLIGQQFKAMLITVNSLADFSILLLSGAVVSCSIFNLNESTETWEDTLKGKVEEIVIVYVDDFKEDRLEVTLYDQGGVKIKLIDRDENAYESVELLCPYLIMYSTLSGEISHLEENTIFIQPSDCSQSVEYLVNAMFEYYENIILENPLTPVETYIYAVRGSDTNWYRGRVTDIKDSQVTVNYIDYGNSEEVEIGALRELTAEFMDVQMMCVNVIIKEPSEDLLGQFVVVNLTFTETGLEGTIQEQGTPALPIENTEIPCEPTVSTEDQEQVLENQSPAVNVEEGSDVLVSSLCGTQVILSHTDSPSDFYLQLSESLDSIEELQATLQSQISEMADMENPVVGVLCAAPYSLDQQWYRAQVLDADTDITTVRFVDYGNTDVLDNTTTQVKTLPPNLLSLEVHATRCRLKIKPMDEEWTSAATERFEQLCGFDALGAQFISQDEKTNYVELYSNGVNVREVLIEEKLALPDEVLTDTSSQGFVSHLNSPSEFWIQLENCVEELEYVAEQLSGAENFPELEDLAPGALCAALFPDDQLWYRARILSNTVAGIEVLFVDYGNSCISCSLRELPEELVMLPPMAQKCSLQKPENLNSWGPEMIRKFSEISAEGQTTFNVQKLSTGETATVVLLLDGVDVTTLLLPKTEDVRVKSFEGFDQISLIKDDQELKTKYKLETLPGVSWNKDSFNKFEEINNNGETVFQSEFVAVDTVRLYLGLNDIRLDLHGTKITTPTSSPLKIRSERLEGDITHSENNTGSNVDCLPTDESIVREVEQSTNQLETSEKSSLVDCESIVESTLREVVEQSINQVETSGCNLSDVDTKDSPVDSVLPEIIDQNINQANDSNSPAKSLVANIDQTENIDFVVESPSCIIVSDENISKITSVQESSTENDAASFDKAKNNDIPSNETKENDEKDEANNDNLESSKSEGGSLDIPDNDVETSSIGDERKNNASTPVIISEDNEQNLSKDSDKLDISTKDLQDKDISSSDTKTESISDKILDSSSSNPTVSRNDVVEVSVPESNTSAVSDILDKDTSESGDSQNVDKSAKKSDQEKGDKS